MNSLSKQSYENYLYLKKKSETYTVKQYQSVHLSQEVYQDNVKDLDIWADHHRKKFGIYGIDEPYLQWIDKILEMKVIKLGRLQFEHSESSHYPNLQVLFPQEDLLILNVHIRAGEKLIPSLCEGSYQEAAAFYRKRNPSFTRILFLCDSWLLHPILSKILPVSSNILTFQKKYTIFSENPADRQMEERVFGFLSEDASHYPEDTTLQRLLKEELKKGTPLGSAMGMFLF